MGSRSEKLKSSVSLAPVPISYLCVERPAASSQRIPDIVRIPLVATTCWFTTQTHAGHMLEDYSADAETYLGERVVFVATRRPVLYCLQMGGEGDGSGSYVVAQNL